MATIFSSDDCRLQARVIVNSTELDAKGKTDIMWHICENLAKSLLHKIISDRVIQKSYDEIKNQVELMLDVYVLTPSELSRLLAEACESGERDAVAWIKVSREGK